MTAGQEENPANAADTDNAEAEADISEIADEKEIYVGLSDSEETE